ncbi:MAG TPA: ribonuclease P protein component [Candidatus Acidoferrum sp.]|nr:ribonuclease P protein component [Candidatus Acidoferrum sp.]
MDGRYLRHAARRGATVSRESDSPRQDFPRTARLVRRSEYDAVYREGRRRTSREFAVFLRANGLDESRFGWSIKKALGSAVKRNRIRRRIREIIRLHRQEISPGWDIVIHPRTSVATAEFVGLTEELLKILPKRGAQVSTTQTSE